MRAVIRGEDEKSSSSGSSLVLLNVFMGSVQPASSHHTEERERENLNNTRAANGSRQDNLYLLLNLSSLSPSRVAFLLLAFLITIF
jgi:hypothetical protein